MKKTLAVCFFLLLFVFFSSAEESGKTVLIPKEVYVGDNAEVRYTFIADNCILTDASVIFSQEQVTLLYAEAGSADFSVTGGSLVRNNDQITLSIGFVPWIVGNIDFPPIDINRVLVFPDQSAVPSCMVDIPPVTISSIVDRMGVTQIRPPAAPLVMPGTSYAIYGVVCILLLVMAGLIIMVVRFRSISAAFRIYVNRSRQIRNYRCALRRLRCLQKKKSTDIVFCAAQIQFIFRSFMESRFCYPFTTLSTQELLAAVVDLSGGMAPPGIVEAVECLFRECDYIRYSGQSAAAADPHLTVETLIVQAIDCLVSFENGKNSDRGVS